MHNEYSMLANLDWHHTGHYASLPVHLKLCETTGSSPADRMIPWINTQTMHDEADHLGLIEYLAAPYDPAKDSSENKPYAHKRFLMRGHGRPWTEDFHEVLIELSNEAWHNRKGKSYIGVGPYGTVHQYGHDYGLHARYFIELMRSSPYWNDSVANIIKIGINGNYTAEVLPDGSVDGFGPKATAACKIHDFETHANYYGPRWELKEKQETELKDEAYQRYLASGN